MNIKEQIKQAICDGCELVGICTVSSCKASKDAQRVADWFQSNNYYQLQADSEGLVGKDYLCWEMCHAIYEDCEMNDNCLDLQNAIKAITYQKALCDAEFRKEKNGFAAWVVKIIEVLKDRKFSTDTAISGLEAMVKTLEESK